MEMMQESLTLLWQLMPHNQLQVQETSGPYQGSTEQPGTMK